MSVFTPIARALTGGPARPDEPPLVRAPVPFFGHAWAMGRDLRGLLRDCQRVHGDVFTLLIAGQRMTFVVDPFSYTAVLKAQDDLSFREIGEEFGHRAFGYQRFERSGLDHEAVQALYSAYLKGPALALLTERAGERTRAAVDRETGPGWREVGLYAFVSRCVFQAGLEALFGEGVAEGELLREFQRFDRRFPLLVAGVPIWMLPQARASLARILAAIDALRADTSEFIRTRDALFLRGSTPDDKRRLQAAVVWAATANTLPAAFWSLAYLLHDPSARAEISAEVEEHGVEDPKRLPKLQSAVSEALRLSSAALTIREVRRDCHLSLESGLRVALRVGDRVALSSFTTHDDPEIFPDPDVYRFDRFLSEDGPKHFFKRGKRVPIPLMPYGGGVSMCPGRFLANSEIVQFVALALRELDLELMSALPPFDYTRAGLGVMPPVGDVRCRLRRRT